MGNRAVIAFGTEPTDIGIYLHWNGGPEKVKAFLDATRTLMKARGPDAQYGPARLIQVIGNFVGGVHSLGIGQLRTLDEDNGDNGVYTVDPESLEIIGRRFARGDATFNQKEYMETMAEALEASAEPFRRKP
jgi:hypothetical protein